MDISSIMFSANDCTFPMDTSDCSLIRSDAYLFSYYTFVTTSLHNRVETNAKLIRVYFYSNHQVQWFKTITSTQFNHSTRFLHKNPQQRVIHNPSFVYLQWTGVRSSTSNKQEIQFSTHCHSLQQPAAAVSAVQEPLTTAAAGSPEQKQMLGYLVQLQQKDWLPPVNQQQVPLLPLILLTLPSPLLLLPQLKLLLYRLLVWYKLLAKIRLNFSWS